MTLLWIGSAGAIGGIARYMVMRLLPSTGTSFPWGVFTVNMIGCLIAGLFFGWAEQTQRLSPEARQALFIGFLGAFTTFSAFALDSIRLFESKHIPLAVLYYVGSPIGGLLLVGAGLWLIKATAHS